MFFKSAQHKERFLAAIQGHVYSGKVDQEYGACLYILAAELFLWKEAQGYITRNGINIPVMLESVHLSSGYNTLVRLAGNLFNSEVHIDPVDFCYLDEENFQVALAALYIRYAAHRLDEF